ncbi:MAG: 3-phosphoshikimate 1-carboxyvinyltransferase [Terriglobia bacterium]
MLRIKRATKLAGVANIPGDKSISHRALLIGSIAEGKTVISGFLASKDCLRTLTALRVLGVQIDTANPQEVVVWGKGRGGCDEPDNILYAGNSGTTLRMLSGVLAGQSGFSVITGDSSLRKRPMDRVIAPLRKMGAEIWARNSRYAPIAFNGHKLSGISYDTPIPSAQVKSAVLLAGANASGRTTVREQYRSRDHTERMLQFLGAEIKVDDRATTIAGGKSFFGREIDVPADISSAMFLIVAALIVPGSDIEIRNVGINQTRTGALRVLRDMGASIEESQVRERCNEPRADLRVRHSQLSGVEIQGEVIPQLIDELPALAVAASQAEGRTVIRGAEELRVKESDRIFTIKNGLERMGAVVEEYNDGFSIAGPSKLTGAAVSSYGDHRIALAMATAGLVADGETSIDEAQCIEVSFPSFEGALAQLAGDQAVVVEGRRATGLEAF